MSAVLERTIFETSRASEYFDAGELQAQTGQARDRFAAVILKELVDNALDACETAGLAPCITIDVTEAAGALQIAVADNGIGISAETVERITNFQTRTSDKAAYKAPTRGAQGNALKTVLGIPCALGQSSPVLIEAHGVRHAVTAWLDPGGELRLDHQATPMPTSCGTRISATVPATGQEFWPTRWVRAFALVNPHASVRIRGFVLESKHSLCATRDRGFLPTIDHVSWQLAEVPSNRSDVALVVRRRCSQASRLRAYRRCSAWCPRSYSARLCAPVPRTIRHGKSEARL